VLNAYEFTLQLLLEDRQNPVPLWHTGIECFEDLIHHILSKYKEEVTKQYNNLTQKANTLRQEIERRETIINGLKSKSVEEGRNLIRKELEANRNIMNQLSKDLQKEIKFLDECQCKAKAVSKEKVLETDISKAILSAYSPIMTHAVLRLQDLQWREKNLRSNTADDQTLDTAFQNKISAVSTDKQTLEEELKRTEKEAEAIKN
jgi:hypothetical protein